MCAGASSVHAFRQQHNGHPVGHTVTTKRHLPTDAPWLSSTAYLNRNPAALSSFHSEAVGATLTFAGEDYTTYATNHECIHVIDNQGVIKALEERERPPTVRARVRTPGRYWVEEMTRTKPANCVVEWIKGHSGNAMHDRADRRAKRASFRPPHRTDVRRFPDSPFHFHLYFYECLVRDDARKHVKIASGQHHLLRWRAQPGQGALNANAAGKRAMPPLSARKHARLSEDFMVRYASGLLRTPHTEHKIGKLETPKCPLCGAADANIQHVLHECTHATMKDKRRDLREEVEGMIHTERHTYTGRHEYHAHPARKIPIRNLYPYATDLHREGWTGDAQLHVSGLPESRWYRQVNTGKIEVYPPQGRMRRTPPLEISTSEFWRLIAWHEHTHEKVPLPSARYDERAAYIYEVIGHTADRGNRADKLCWATHRTLLHIICDELHCETELFSDMMNTFHRFKERRSLRNHRAFALHGGLRLDGLDPTAYNGSVYANPPFDSYTIRASMNIARRRARTPGFRGVYFVPMTEEKLASFRKEKHGRVLMRFPTGTVPFIHPDHWKGNAPRNGGLKKHYDEENTCMVLVMFESANLGELTPVNHQELEAKLADWHMSVMPKHKRCVSTYLGTGINMSNYKVWGYPEEMRVWEATRGERTGRLKYAGAMFDANALGETPGLDVVEWDSNLALMGVFPDSFPKFLRSMGHKADKVGPLTRKLALVFRNYIRRTYWAYTALVKATTPRERESPVMEGGRRLREAGRVEDVEEEARRRAIKRGKAQVSETGRGNDVERRAAVTEGGSVGGTNQAESSSSGCRGAVWRREEEGAMVGRRVRGRDGSRRGSAILESGRKRNREHNAGGQSKERARVERRVRGMAGHRRGSASLESGRKRNREHNADGHAEERSSVTPPRQVLRYL